MISSSDRHASRVRVLRGDDSRRAAPAPRTLGAAAPRVHEHGTGPSTEDRVSAARQEGYEQGYDAGLADAAGAVERERLHRLRRLAERIEQTATAIAVARAGTVAEVQQEAVDLAFELAEAILQRELVLGTSVTRDAVVRALALVPRGHDLEVRVHPGDALAPEDLSSLVPGASVTVVADPAVEIGGCIVESGPCRVDAQIGDALARARALFAAVAPPAPGAAPSFPVVPPAAAAGSEPAVGSERAADSEPEDSREPEDGREPGDGVRSAAGERPMVEAR